MDWRKSLWLDVSIVSSLHKADSLHEQEDTEPKEVV